MSKTSKIILLIVVLIGAVGFLTKGNGLVTWWSSSSEAAPKKIGALYFRQHIDAYEGLKEGMKKIGYTKKDAVYDEVLIIPGPNLQTDLENGVRKLIADKVDVMFVSYEDSAKIALKLTKEAGVNIPIVFTTRFHDPISYGLIKAYKASGNNSTGVATNLIETIQKSLSYFKEINPKAEKIGVFGEGFMVPGGSDAILAELKKQAPRFGLAIVEYKTQKPPSPEKDNWYEVADKIQPGDIDGLFQLPIHFYDPQETHESLLASRLHIPHAVPSEDMPTGGTFSFADDFHASAGQSAVMIDKIFKGAKPGEIPVEFGSKSLLIINQKRADDAGFTFPASMLFIANEKITK